MKNFFLLSFLASAFLCQSCGNVTSENKPDTAKKDTLLTTTNKIGLPPLQISFPSLDGLIISADSYLQNDTLPWILLCHQAGYSRGEYKETAAKFEAFGYNCLAIDQRSGGEVNGVKNLTAEQAKQQGKSTDYLDAEQDILAAINYLYTNSKKPIVLVGSSYSAGLVLKIVAERQTGKDPKEIKKIKAVLSFSPGEYYGKKFELAKNITKINVPVFITCAKSEVKDTRKIFDAIEYKGKLFYSPTSEGKHASSALWESTDDYKEYWKAVGTFFELLK